MRPNNDELTPWKESFLSILTVLGDNWFKHQAGKGRQQKTGCVYLMLVVVLIMVVIIAQSIVLLVMLSNTTASSSISYIYIAQNFLGCHQNHVNLDHQNHRTMISIVIIIISSSGETECMRSGGTKVGQFVK